MLGYSVVAGITQLNAIAIPNVVSEFRIHPQYDPRTLVNDVAVIKVMVPFLYDQFVQPVQLASNNPNPGEILTLSGWGKTSYPGIVPNDLQYIQLVDLDLQSCANQLQGTNPITRGNVCTTSRAGQGGCQGDSGGPLVNSNSEQVGVVSWGVPCARGAPDVYSSVAFYMDFITYQ